MANPKPLIGNVVRVPAAHRKPGRPKKEEGANLQKAKIPAEKAEITDGDRELARLVLAASTKSDVAAAFGLEPMAAAMSAVRRGAAIAGAQGAADRAMLSRILGLPFATSESAKAGGKANAGAVLDQLQRALAAREARTIDGSAVEMAPIGRVPVTERPEPPRKLGW